jgi:uncharacterized protein (TIGR02246 family)
MRKLGLFSIPLVLAASAVTLAIAQGSTAEDEAGLKAIVKTLEDGWNAGDSSKFASPFAVNADYVVVNGQHIKTRPIIDFGHKQIFSTIYKGSVNKGEVKQIRFIKSDVAIVHVEWTLKYGEKLENSGRAMNSIVAVKQNNKWEIAAFQNTPIQ